MLPKIAELSQPAALTGLCSFCTHFDCFLTFDSFFVHCISGWRLVRAFTNFQPSDFHRTLSEHSRKNRNECLSMQSVTLVVLAAASPLPPLPYPHWRPGWESLSLLDTALSWDLDKSQPPHS